MDGLRALLDTAHRDRLQYVERTGPVLHRKNALLRFRMKARKMGDVARDRTSNCKASISMLTCRRADQVRQYWPNRTPRQTVPGLNPKLLTRQAPIAPGRSSATCFRSMAMGTSQDREATDAASRDASHPETAVNAVSTVSLSPTRRVAADQSREIRVGLRDGPNT